MKNIEKIRFREKREKDRLRQEYSQFLASQKIKKEKLGDFCQLERK